MSMSLERRAWWHPAAASADVSDRPLAVGLLNVELVLWRDAPGGGLNAFVDRCPHRGSRLSLGRVRPSGGGSRLECPYHGWQFAADGRCVRIPAAPGFVPTASHAACRHPALDACGLAWVLLAEDSGQDADGGAVPRGALPASASAGPVLPDGVPALQIVCGPYEVATSAPRVVENFLDTAHFAFVHEGGLGAAAQPEVPRYDVVLDARGAPGVPHYRAWQPQASASSKAGRWVDYRYQVLTPYTAWLGKRLDAGADVPDATGVPAPGRAGGHGPVARRAPFAADVPDDAYLIAACPLTPETTRVWFVQFTADAGASADALRAFQHTIFLQDRPILESQRPKCLPIGPDAAEAHSAADRFSVAYRRYLREQGVRFGVV